MHYAAASKPLQLDILFGVNRENVYLIIQFETIPVVSNQKWPSVPVQIIHTLSLNSCEFELM